ncbi:PSD1 and planctomycete cytochrome C domain-containing protein [Roseibacillus persicicus]|uniref:PSD1 and planctomycete cytochrome C domain-containing protein n=1 Tax=Roseibacillus persicicus TaxID=454148 RepID=UPI00280CF976|nr:PSD1 and planctomycete cytochrome C domain-containing protein [Roseibacillus persicicus]MDQ8189186.1 PSD1 and planctomycete cytochrome C domain-containing protein [Roseibacillus persicicus]
MKTALSLSILLIAPALMGQPSDAELEFFEREVRPVLANSCYECHSVEAKKVKAGLWLDSRAAILEGGDNGPAIVPGDPEASLLIETIRYQNVELEMPPKSKLADNQIAALEKWVEMGAPWPEEEVKVDARKKAFDLDARRAEHWCWQPPVHRATPEVQQTDWPLNPVDSFILAKLEEGGLKPAPDTDRRSWIRRVTFDLIGLPPSPEEVKDFLTDEDERAFERVVERLLASPHYGEKWARHWMDLMRYGEGYGHEFDYSIPHAWRYRDYLIQAFNEDVPYDQFLIEHVAGDQIEKPRVDPESGINQSLVATGSWWLGESVHAPTDVRGDEVLRMDNQIDVFSKSFLGLTVSCARCHDHKFDAISTADFYALAGFLQSSRRTEALMDPHGKIAAGVAQLEQIQSEASHLLEEAGIFDLPPGSPDAIANFDSGLPAGWSTEGFAFPSAPTSSIAVALGDAENPIVPRGVVHSGLLADRLSGYLRSPTFTLTEPEIHLRVAGKGNVSARVVIDGYYMHSFHQLLFGGTILQGSALDTGGKYEWKTLGGDLRKYVGHQVYLEFEDKGEGYLAIDEVSYGRAEHSSFNLLVPDRFDASSLQPYQKKAAAIAEGLPNAVRTLALVDGTPENDYVHIRGSHRSLGDEVTRRGLSALDGEELSVPSDASGRLELAKSLVSGGHPLTARVYVNRLWHYLFGVGIVPSVDDFGVMGQEPSHLELLDWLALDFAEKGWSTKEMIRQLVLSRTYRQSCVADPANSPSLIEQVDPSNILLHKARVRRLPAESIRDSILSVSGTLNPKVGGGSVPVYLTSFMEGRGMPQSGPLDGGGRRSLYLAIKRNFLSPFEAAFDRPIPFTSIGRRSVSNVPAQSLTLMNDPFVIQEAARWGKQLLEVPGEDRIARAFVQAFARPPLEVETETLRGFLTTQQESYQCGPDDERLWADFCHLLINKKEFIYLK